MRWLFCPLFVSQFLHCRLFLRVAANFFIAIQKVMLYFFFVYITAPFGKVKLTVSFNAVSSAKDILKFSGDPWSNLRIYCTNLIIQILSSQLGG